MLSVLVIFSSVVAGVGLAPASDAATLGLSDPQPGRIVGTDPANFTPHALNGTVYSMVQVGDYIVVGGTFTSVRSASNTTAITRNRVFAFNAETGVINKAFNPAPNGTVYKVQQAPGTNMVYVGGNFTNSAAGSSRKNLFRINVETGAVDTSFTPASTNGSIRDLEVVGSNLWVGGKFTHIGGRAQKGLGTINASNGALNSYYTLQLAGLHRDCCSYDVTDVLQMSSNVQNTELTVVGNFTNVNGTSRPQIAKFSLGASSASLSPWYTNLFTQACSSKFDTYMSDVEYSPNGQFLVVSTTGAYGGSASNTGTSGCDVVARWEAGDNASPIPTWTAYTGGDTTWSVEVTDNVVYAGGHQRWQNNPTRGDAAGQGAVSREGIAALNTLNGMPYSWNPTRTRGVGIQDMLATPDGLWVGSDTDRIGAYEYHGRIALMPLSGGKDLPAQVNANLPGTVYTVPTGGSTLSHRSFDGTTPGSVTSGPSGGPAWGSVVGAFMSNGVLYTATSNGQLSKQTFNGSTFGSSSLVNKADALVPQTDWHNTDVPGITSLFFHDGKMFFTRSGQSSLFRRGFEPESDVVGQQRFSSSAVSGINYANVRGAFVADGKFYYATTTGALFRADWSGNSPVGGTSVQVSGPGKDSQTWNSRAMFVYQGTGQQQNQPPIIDADVSCTGLDCDYDASGSTDPGGSIASYLWQFGDGDTSDQATTTHPYATPGPRTVTLTVTDNLNAQSTATYNINPQPPVDSPPTANIASASCNLLVCTFSSAGSGDSQGPVSYLWDFGEPGDTDTSTEPNPTFTYDTAGPRTVTLTVTDSALQESTDTQGVNPSDTASPVTFVAKSHTNANRQSHTVTVPAGTQVGDALVLFFAANTTTPTYTYPAGWTAVGGALNGSGIVGRAFTKVATAADLGSTVRVTSTSYAKSDMALAVYRGTDGTTPVAASAGALDNTTTTAHTSPTVNAPAGSKWLITYWADKSTSTSAWTAPGGQNTRSTAFGTSSGHMAGLLTDSGADVSGSTGGLTATANSSTNRALSFSIVLQ